MHHRIPAHPEVDGPELSVVVPAYRSEGCLGALLEAIDAELGPRGLDYEVILVNDGSPDRTWSVIEGLCASHPHLVGVDLRRNFGQDNAILAGLRQARGRFVAIMDDDLQHHPRDLPALLARAEAGADVVYANFRVKRQKPWKNLGSWFNGKVAEWVLGKPRHIYISPFKVIRGEVADLVCRYEGPDPYVDGLLFQVTSRFEQIDVEHHARHAGTGNFTPIRSLMIWARLATGFSIRPLRLVTFCGIGLGLLGALLATLVLLDRLLYPERFAMAVAGWASLMVALLLVGGIQMIFLGILGEYAGRTHTTLAGKPQATVREVLRGVPDVEMIATSAGRPGRGEGEPWRRA